MLNFDLIRAIATPEEYIPLIKEYDIRFGSRVAPIAKKYMLTDTLPACIPYTDDTQRTDAYMHCKATVAKVTALSTNPEEQAMLAYLFWLHCLPYLHRFYMLMGLDTQLFAISLQDLNYKVRECVKVNGYPGLFVDWFFLFTQLKLFAFGRLQYELVRFPYEEYSAGGYTLRKGDPVYSLHVPSIGPLTQEACFDSFRKAYGFFKKDLPGTIMPMIIHSWLLYPPYQGVTFPPDSNVGKFAAMFDIQDVHHTPQFGDCWNVFGMHDPGSTDLLPAETSMQRRFIDYIKAGGTYGYGSGVLLYDGEHNRLLNR